MQHTMEEVGIKAVNYKDFDMRSIDKTPDTPDLPDNIYTEHKKPYVKKLCSRKRKLKKNDSNESFEKLMAQQKFNKLTMLNSVVRYGEENGASLEDPHFSRSDDYLMSPSSFQTNTIQSSIN